MVNVFSGCPGDIEGGRTPNWVTTPWPPEFAALLKWQWEECALPFWTEAAASAQRHGVRIAVEPHPGFLVYNVATLLRLRGGRAGHRRELRPEPPLVAGRRPGRGDPPAGRGGRAGPRARQGHLAHEELIRAQGVIDTTARDRVGGRAWAFRTVGLGHGEERWRDLLGALRAAGYDGVVSVEHEDPPMSAEEGLAKAVDTLLALS